MELVHQRVTVRVDGQYREAVQCLALRVAPGGPEAGHAQGFTIGVADAGGHGFAAAPVGFKEGFDRDDAVLRFAPGVPEAGLFGDGFRARVVGVAGNFGVFGPVRDQAEAAQQRLALGHRVITHVGMGVAADEGAQVARPDITAGQLAGQVNAEVSFEAGLVVDGFEMGAHVDIQMKIMDCNQAQASGSGSELVIE